MQGRTNIINALVLIFSLAMPGMSMAISGGGTLVGQVFYHGKIPAAKTVSVLENQEVCGKSVVHQTVRVDVETRGLQSAVVSIESKGNLLERSGMPPTILMNEDCNFSPRIAAAQSLDDIEIRNRDPILHNTHITINQRTFLNVAQLPGSRPITKTIKRAGLHQILCDKHNFMSGVLMVFDHPYFRVTNEKGEFSLTGIPVGQYVARVWHERLGTLEQKVTISSKEAVTLNFNFP